MIRKISPDIKKSDSLKKMAKITLERLNKTEIEEYPSNTLVDYYDIIHKFMDALALEKGIKFKGDGVHKELIDYISGLLNFSLSDRQFLQNMRDYRNRITYEGFMVNKDYILLNRQKINNIIGILGDK